MSLREFRPNIEEQLILEDSEGYGSLKEIVGVLQHLKPGEEYIKKVHDPDSAPVRQMEAVVANLRKAGLDIGKGDMAFGFKMPLPKKGNEYSRELIIFRRR